MTRSLPGFLMVGNASYRSRGCEAIVRGTIEVLAAQFPNAKFILSSFGGADARKDAEEEIDARIEHRPHDPNRVRKWTPQWVKYRLLERHSPVWLPMAYSAQYSALRECDCALEIGGDNYSLDYGHSDTFIQLDRLLLSTGKPLVLWGASVGPFSDNPEVEDIFREHLQRFDLVLARESATVAYLASIGVSENVRLVADPAFTMKPAEPDISDDLRAFLDKRPIGLNLSGLVGRFREGGREEWPAGAAECIRALLDLDAGPLLLVPHDLREAHNNDYEFMLSAMDVLGRSDGRVQIVPPTLSATEYKWVISQLRAHVGARTHTTIASLSSCVPTVSIGYSMKARGINRDVFGHEDWVIPIQELTPAGLSSKVALMLDQESLVRQRLAEVIPEMVKRAYSAGELLGDLLNAGNGGR